MKRKTLRLGKGFRVAFGNRRAAAKDALNTLATLLPSEASLLDADGFVLHAKPDA